ncbi:diguanylate cyclase [Halodurantibacterium flavum]|uniref:diguanylate cyclase n=1 Tax=Halodurantibacterium flavum TaxID=1382802 RepID=A0ABW4S1M8_9RHOB
MAGQILIADGDSARRKTLENLVSAACHPVAGVATLPDLRAALRDGPALILLGPLGDAPPQVTARIIRARPDGAALPVIALCADADVAGGLACLEAGADEVLSDEVLGDDAAPALLMAQIRALLRRQDELAGLHSQSAPCRAIGLAEPGALFESLPRIALVAATAQRGLAWQRALEPWIAAEFTVMDRAEALGGVLRGAPAGARAADIYLIDAAIEAAGDGLQLLASLRSRASSRQAAVAVVLGPDEWALGATALDLGADALVPDRFRPQEVALRLGAHLRRKREGDRLQSLVTDGLQLAIRDPLTGLFNRRYALSELGRIEAQARRSGRSFVVMAIDIDHFKAVNDTWGHAAGDAVLARIARLMQDGLREADLLARTGGEEFLIVLPGCQIGAARQIAEGLRRRIAETPVALPGLDGAVQVTISIGLAVGDGSLSRISAEEALRDADRALLRAKAGGRNQVTISARAA